MARTWAEIEALGLTAPEQALVAACRAGVPCLLGDARRPEGPDPARTVRAEVLRFLIVGGGEGCRVSGRGVSLFGAFVSGVLELAFAQGWGQTVLRNCRFAAPIDLQQARLQLLSLEGSAVPGLFAEGAQVSGGVFLRAGFVAEGEVNFAAAIIGGPLSCVSGRFAAARDVAGKPEGFALNVQGAQVTGGVFLRAGFAAKGEVRLAGARVGGPLSCEGGRFAVARNDAGSPVGMAMNAQDAQVTDRVLLSDGFVAEGEVNFAAAIIGGPLSCVSGRFAAARDAAGKPVGKALNAAGVQVKGGVFLSDGFVADGEVSLLSATIGGQFACAGGHFTAARDGGGKPVGLAINGQRMRVADGFFFRNVHVETGSVYLASAEVSDLVDDPASWPEAGRLYLDGFTYERIAGSFTDSRRRLDWLAKGTVWDGDFHPQPYTQLAKVLGEMGHDRAAREVLVERERLIACHARARLRARPLADRDGFDRLFGVHTVRARAAGLAGWDGLVRWVVGYGYQPFRSLVWLAGLWLTAATLAHLAWVSGAMVPNSGVILTSDGWLAVVGQPDAAAVWAVGAGGDWETFSAAAWGLDLVVPILDLGQIATWAPSTARGPWGTGLWWGRWVLIVMGWVVVGLAAAAVTGIIRRE